ncbi:MAG: hypothetical protein P1P81_00190 [Desulfobulbales bacterium]|nr:hypothetical protein [Desulfobulbales bacterium]
MPKYIPPRLLLLLSLSALLIGCDFGDLRLITQFNRINGLQTGDRIIYRDKYIGDIERITRSERGHYLVELDIDSDHKEQLTVYSIFYIDKDPDHPGRKAVFTEQRKPGGILLTDDSVVAGLDYPPHLRNMLDDLKLKTEELGAELAATIDRAGESYQEKSSELTNRLELSLAEIERKLQEIEEAMQSTPDRDEVRKLKKGLDRLAADLESTLEQVKTVISDDLLTGFKKSLADLRRRLEKTGRESNPSPEPAERARDDLTI